MRPEDWFWIGLSFCFSLVLTPVVRALARRIGMVARPRTDRWHKKPTALLGGVAICVAVLATSFAAGAVNPQIRAVLFTSGFLFLVGLVDDLLHIKPYQKLIGQVMGAALVIWADLGLNWTPSPLINQVLTVLWVVGITNAINLLDNMDGLAGGISAIAAIALGWSFWHNGQPAESLLMGIFAAALVGFLVYNSNPASIFMGDCGSMFLGFYLASFSLMNLPGLRSRSLLPVLTVPLLILLIPIFDTTFVTVLRKLSGRAASTGGRDHTSHRLVALGLSERHAVWLLYGLALLSGGLALVVQNYELDVSLTAIIAFVLALTLLGIHLAGVKVYSDEEIEKARKQPLVAFLVNLSYKRRLFEVILDVVLVVLAYRLAYFVRYGPPPTDGSATWQWFYMSVPLLVLVKIPCFLIMGVYRGIWQYVSVDSLITYGKAVMVASLVSLLAYLVAFRPDHFSRTVFVLDTVFLFSFLAASRGMFRIVRRLLPSAASRGGRRVLIYGAGDAGELLLRELRRNHTHQAKPVGFLDDDPLKHGRSIHGLPVIGGNGTMRDLLDKHQAEMVLISSSRFTSERIEEILQVCKEAGVALKRMIIKIETLTDDDEVPPPEPASSENTVSCA